MARLTRPPAEERVSPHTSLNRSGDRLHTSLSRTTSAPMAIPDIPRDLLEYLDTVFPDRIDSGWRDIGEVREAIGTRKVVDHLRRLHREQEQNNVPGG